jgi:hypothetical protein
MLIWRKTCRRLALCIETPPEKCKSGDDAPSGDDSPNLDVSNPDEPNPDGSDPEPWYRRYLDQLRAFVLRAGTDSRNNDDQKKKETDDGSSVDQDGDYLEGGGYDETMADVHVGSDNGPHIKITPSAPAYTEHEPPQAANSDLVLDSSQRSKTDRNGWRRNPAYTSSPRTPNNAADKTNPRPEAKSKEGNGGARIPSKFGIPQCSAADVGPQSSPRNNDAHTKKGPQQEKQVQPDPKPKTPAPMCTRSHTQKE